MIHIKVKENIIRIAYSFIKNNEKLRSVIKKLIPKDYLEDKIIIKSKWQFKLMNNNTGGLFKHENVQEILQKGYIENELKAFKHKIITKYYGCKLYDISFFTEFQNTKDLDFIQSNLKIYYFYFY